MNHHNYNYFIIFSIKYFFFKDFIFTTDSLIKYKKILKINNTFINNKYILNE